MLDLILVLICVVADDVRCCFEDVSALSIDSRMGR